MTGDRSLKVVIWIFSITAAVLLIVGGAALDQRLSRGEPAHLGRLFGYLVWYVLPTVFLARGSNKARIVCLVISIISMFLPGFILWGALDSGQLPPLFSFMACLAWLFATVAFLFAIWALGFYSPLREALKARVIHREKK